MAADSDEKGDDPGSSGESSNKSSQLTKTASEIVASEVAAEVIRSEQGSQVNINVLLVQLTQRATTSEETLASAERAFELARKFEHQRLEDFKARTDAVIEIKNKDPDEVEKRANNRTRRHLKYGLASCALGGLSGGLALALAGGSIVPCGLLLGVGAMSVALLGPLASGESVSSNDVVRIVQSLRSLFPSQSPPQSPQPPVEPFRRKKK